MKITTDRKVVQQGTVRVTKGEIVEVPDALGKEWIAAKIARAPTAAEIKAAAKNSATV